MQENEEGISLYTDEQVTNASGLHTDNLRKLITWGAVKPYQSGGGRGRVRLWTARQALRVSVAAQFFDVGYSLKMAHTLTYCIPIYDLLTLFELMIVEGKLEDQILLEKLKDDAFGFQEPMPGHLNILDSRVIIVDGQYLYNNTGPSGEFLVVAAIDQKRNRVAPMVSPYEQMLDTRIAIEHGLPIPRDATEISRTSLLIDDSFLRKSSKRRSKLRMAVEPPDELKAINSSAVLSCRNVLSINLAVGLFSFVRRLLNLPDNYRPYEIINNA